MANKYSLSNDRRSTPLGSILRVIILLLVITGGIYIAFNLENRGGKEKISALRTQYLQDIRSEMVDNLKTIGQEQKVRERQVLFFEKLIAAASRIVSDDTIRLAIDELLQQRFQPPTMVTYDNMVAAGKLSLIASDSLRARLVSLKQLESKAPTIESGDAQMISNQLEPYLSKRQVIYLLEIKTSDRRQNLTVSKEQTGRVIRTLLQDRTFIDLIYLRMNRVKSTVDFSNSTQSQLEEVTDYLDKALAEATN